MTMTIIWIITGAIIFYGLGIITMQALAIRDLRKLKSSIEAALKTGEYHKDNYPDDENIAI